MKKIIIAIISILFLSTIIVILQVNQISKSVANSVVNTVILELDEQLKVYENSNRREIKINSSNFKNELFQQIEFKTLKRVTREEWLEKVQNAKYYLEYSSGKESYYIDNGGRILVTEDKGNVRNKSVFHWLWWRFDNRSDNNTGIYYLSEQDKGILDFIDVETN
ncbi:UNVERIFIED_CONTAM: hypothetical protein Cloal_0578 [Acetivibrio alkalicellulosi]